MKYKIIFTTLIIIVLSTISLIAGNSAFSYISSPCQNYGNDIYGMTMGDVGYSDVFRLNTGFGNPAIMTGANYTLFSTGMQMGWTVYTTKTDSLPPHKKRLYRDNSLDFPFFSFVVPLKKHYLGFQFNSISSGLLQNQTTFEVDSISVVEKQYIDRYLYRADLLYAWRYRKFSLGMSVNYYLGHKVHRLYQDGGFGAFNTNEKMSYTFKNPSVSMGITYKFENVALGLAYSKQAVLKGEMVHSSIHETENLGVFNYHIPDQFSGGITAKLFNEYKISSDLHYELWSKINNQENNRNSLKVGVGFAQEPKREEYDTFLGQTSKRIGLSYRILSFNVRNQPVSEISLCGGLTLPLRVTENSIDLGAQYILRGNVNKHKLQDNALMFFIGITGFDILTQETKKIAPRDIPKKEELSDDE